MKNLNKKGFTLIELLAVIVVLAIIMVLAVPNVLTAMNNAKKSSFVLYEERIVTAAQSYFQQEMTLGKTMSETIGCKSLTDIGLTNSGNFKGSVMISGNTSAEVTYRIYLADGDYYLNGFESTTALKASDTAIISGVEPATITTCGVTSAP